MLRAPCAGIDVAVACAQTQHFAQVFREVWELPTEYRQDFSGLGCDWVGHPFRRSTLLMVI